MMKIIKIYPSDPKEIRIFINDSEIRKEKYSELFNSIPKNEKLIITYSNEKNLSRILRGYDIYLIRLNNIVCGEEIKRLREEQDWSEIHYLFGGKDNISSEIKENCDGIHSIICGKNLKSILKKSKIKLGMEAIA